jgi:hypothetical protein
MQNSVSTSPKRKPAAARKLRLVPRPAGLQSANLEALKRDLLAELAPQTALQRSVAQNLADNEMELVTLRERKNLIFWEAALQAMWQLLCATSDRDKAWELARAWASGDAGAAAQIGAQDIDPEFALNAAHFETFQPVAMIDTQIDRLERRRRQLHEDLTRLKALLPIAPDLPDAELVETLPHAT